jgi:hypothetical protein
MKPPSFQLTATQAASMTAQTLSQLALGGSEVVKHAIPARCAAEAGRSASADETQAVSVSAKLTARKTDCAQRTENPRPEKTPAEARPLVAREFRNREYTIATAFGRKAWTYAAASRPKWVERQRLCRQRSYRYS